MYRLCVCMDHLYSCICNYKESAGQYVFLLNGHGWLPLLNEICTCYLVLENHGLSRHSSQPGNQWLDLTNHGLL